MGVTNRQVRFQSGVRLAGTVAPTGIAGGPVSDTASKFSSGVLTASSAAKYAMVTGTLAAGATATLDLTSFGGEVFTGVKLIQVRLTSTTGYLRVGNAASDAHQLWFGADAHTADVVQGGPSFLQGGTTAKTVDSSNKNVKLENPHGSESATYEVIVAGNV